MIIRGNTLSWITKTNVALFRKITNNQQNLNNKVTFSVEQESLATEMPVALVYNGISHTVMMCSPQDLADFALGFSLAEGIIQKTEDIYSIEVVPLCNGIEVQIELSSRCFFALKEHRRTLAGRTGCGICGTEQLKQVYKNLPSVTHNFRFDLSQLDNCLNELQQAQLLGGETGATHAATFFNSEGKLLAIREDVGRHVALDKLLGWKAKNSVSAGFVLVTSRASYEMVQKAASCGIEILVAISAATDLAVKMAEQSQMTLVGFTRKGRATVYCGKERLFF